MQSYNLMHKDIVCEIITLDEVTQMPRPKKDGRYLNLYLDRALHEEFEQFYESLGQTKTIAAERAFRMYMDAMKQNSEQLVKNKEER